MVKDKMVDLSLGIDTEGYGEKIAYSKNLIRKNGALVKRKGLKTIHRFIDEELLPLRINGIFTYGEQIIVHAKNRLFKCSSDFSQVSEIVSDVSLPDEKSSAFSLDGLLVINCGGVYIFDGTTLTAFDKREGLYIPKTRVGIRNTKSKVYGNDYEKPNLFTSQRINTLLGEANEERVNRFILDSEALEKMPVSLNLQIRLHHTPTEEETENQVVIDSTTYVGIDSEGNEIEGIANVEFEVSSLRYGTTYFPDKITDERGNDISIKKTDGKIYSASEINWSLQIVGGELRLNMELIPPYSGIDNLTLTFHSKDYLDYTRVKGITAASFKGGAGAIALYLDNGELYYTSSKIGTTYLPKDNRIKIGTLSTKIQGLISMQNGYIGVFASDGFYKTLIPENEECITYKTGDSVTLSSPFAISCIENTPIALSNDGIYGIKTLNGYQDSLVYLEKRSEKIDSLISSFTKKERENSHMQILGKDLYVFIGNKALVTSSDQKSKKDTYSFLQQEWMLLDEINARCSLAKENTLIIGHENGTISTFYDGYSDVDLRELRQDKLEIWTREFSNKTAFVTPYLSQLENGLLLSGNFGVKIGRVLCDSYSMTAPKEVLYLPNGEIRLFEGLRVYLYKDGEKAYEGTILHLEYGLAELDIECDSGEYELYAVNEHQKYEIELINDAFLAKLNGEYITATELKSVTISKITPVSVSLILDNIELGKKCLKIVEGVSIKPTNDTFGEIKITLESDRGVREKSLKIGREIGKGLDLSYFSFEKGFNREYKATFMVLSNQYLKIKIEADEPLPFGIEWLSVSRKGEK